MRQVAIRAIFERRDLMQRLGASFAGSKNCHRFHASATSGEFPSHCRATSSISDPINYRRRMINTCYGGHLRRQQGKTTDSQAHIEARHSGYLLCPDACRAGTIKRAGRICLQPAVDAHVSLGFGKYTQAFQPANWGLAPRQFSNLDICRPTWSGSNQELIPKSRRRPID